MTGTHYTLARDVKQEPEPARKVCKKCNVEKPNDDTHFGLKWSGTRKREDMRHVDVCKKCTGQAVSDRAAEKRAKAVKFKQMQDRELANKVRKLRGLPPLED